MKIRGLELVLTLLIGAPVAAESIAYRVDARESHFTVQVGKAGLFRVFGHDHVIEVRQYEGTVRWNADAPEVSQFRLEVKAGSLTVTDEDVSDDDRAQIQADMESQALAVTEYPAIVFESQKVELVRSAGESYTLKVTGSLDLRGIRDSVEIPLTLTTSGHRLTATGEMKLRTKTWGVPQISAAGGAVKTKDELGLAFEIVAVRE